MPEPEKENPSSSPPKLKGTGERENLMDFDLDFDSCWPLEQISFGPNPTSPFFVSASCEQPCSPLWAFSDVDDDRHAGHTSSTFSDCHRFLACNPNSVSERSENDDNRKLLAPILALTPLENPDGFYVIKERMTQALRYFKELTEQNVLAQIWAPVRNGCGFVLTTSGQPFIIDPRSNGLHQYRMVSVTYMFSVDGESDEAVGLPGRVFQQKLPEWTPDVKYYSCREYPRRDQALHYNVRGTLALPVFEPSGQSCVGVLELIMTSQKINYAPEVDKVCKALEAVNLKSSEILDHPNTQICNEGRQNALAEILEIMTVVCETHKLPLAQTWIPCRHRSVLVHGGGLKKSCSSFDGSCMGQVCMSTTDAAFYVIDAHMWGFREACAEHHLQQGQGVAGRAFLSRNSCFCGNITQFSKTEYPLVHYALMFGLTSCFSICLRSAHTGSDDYILEFFLPPSITNFSEQRTLLGSLLATIKQHIQSIKVASGVELGEDGLVEIVEATNGRLHSWFESITIRQSTNSPPGTDAIQNIGEMVPLDSSEQQLMACLEDMNDGGMAADNSLGNINLISSPEVIKSARKPTQRKRGKAEKSISLEVLQRYFAGSLKDAAKSLSVCPTTMKRICRQHGISRWPSRKINKVNRSLSKLKHVIESVQGADGAFGLNSLSPSPFPIAVGSIPQTSSLNMSNQQDELSPKPSELLMEKNEFHVCQTTEANRQAGIEDQFPGGRLLSPERLIHEKSGSAAEFGKGLNRSKTGSGSSEDSAIPTCHGSCQGSPPNESSPLKDPLIASIQEKLVIVGESLVTLGPTVELSRSIADAVTTEPQEPFGGMLIEDAGSSKDLRNLCPSVADAILDDQVPETCGINHPCSDLSPKQCMDTVTMAHFTTKKEMKSLTIKATYREDIIRFRISLTCSIVELKEEIAKRLKLEVGTFDIKYMDDDQEWVLMACDADFQECLDISRSSGSNIIRLFVHDIMSNLGSSCESSG
ncbi:protein NLP6-like [Quillaja saponaria]|uniref:Protein NLP6-like n=1 Tax=Quillaja saponaria TaxID=32244 RepID=A0AAD7L5Y4_QUISA|nr:protein NLP6-like [Quillaja saponaria]